MRLYLIRHGEAEDLHPTRFPDDASRPLTDAGRESLGRNFERLGPVLQAPQLGISSPLLRAVQTAEIFMKVIGIPGGWETSPALLPEAGEEAIFPELRGEESIVLFGHLPQLPALAAFLLGSRRPLFTLKKGGIACLELQGRPGFGSAWLKWLLTPKLCDAA